jgi:hypothetical protein
MFVCAFFREAKYRFHPTPSNSVVDHISTPSNTRILPRLSRYALSPM